MSIDARADAANSDHPASNAKTGKAPPSPTPAAPAATPGDDMMSKAEWFWAVLLWAGVTTFMLIAIWLNIGTR